MTVDIEKMKALALAAPTKDWYSEHQISDGITWEESVAFIAECNPATVLELIAEVERLKNERDTLCHGYGSAAAYAIELQGEIDRLRAAPAAGTVEKDAELSPELIAVAEFLDGSAPLDGVWFGPPHPSGKPWWWRKNLRAAIEARTKDGKEEA